MLKLMKSIAAMTLMLSMLLCLAACGSSEDSHSSTSSKQSGGEESAATGESAITEETPDEGDAEIRYCDLEECHMMFPHIHITMENWQEYFEFTTGYQFGNGVENMDKYVLTKTMFNVREEWRDQISHLKLHYQVGYKEYSVPGTIDWDNQTITVDENAEKTYSAHKDDQWFTVDSYGYEFDSSTGLTGKHELTMTNDREDYDGTILFWEPEMLEISEGGYIAWKE